ncbi:hypothetical protein AZE42_13129 [Rhizopogon vesiculosus]|uniref:Uncharacterized protein n=1 Tax=Rhizopogon vesiculosus TaxID=180088 RepID=A0A1J8PTA0_9AGAM|nr:hypothetical protein AZE42_13129 [Rhizopogon vesiculosus]
MKEDILISQLQATGRYSKET